MIWQRLVIFISFTKKYIENLKYQDILDKARYSKMEAILINQKTEQKHEKVVLVNPYPYYAIGINEATIYPPLGLAVIAALLEKNNFKVQIIDANILRMMNDGVLRRIEEFGADIVGIQMNVVTARSGIELSNMIKDKTPDTKVVIGGPFTPENLERLLKETKADFFVQGEGEVTFLDICQGKNPEDINGTVYLKDNQITFNRPRELIANLDDLPFAAYHLLPDLKLYRSRSRKAPMAPVFTSRGCPYQCVFCSSSSKKSPFQNRFRFRSAENVVDEIEYLIKRFGIKQIDILDDNFTLYHDRADKILDLIIERKIKVAINLQNGVRADKLTFGMVKKMKKAGVYKLGIGIESGNTEVLKKMKKALDLKDVKNAVKWCREAGIICIGFFMIGFPFDTEETIKETIDFAIKLNPSIANFMTAVPLPGTELYDIVEKNGWLTKPTDEYGTSSGFYAQDFHYEIPHLPKEKILGLQKEAYRRFYFRPSKILEMAKDIRSFNELRWTVSAAKPLIKNMLSKIKPN